MMKRLLPLLLATTFSAAVASPTAPVVVAGQATFNQQGNVFTITNTPNTVINWQSFSIAPGEVTRFVQQSASSAVLNRILGQDPTQILGALQSNGQVFLINPNGVMFGKDARIDVAGLTASTLNLTDADFLAGRRNFSAGPAAGNISNQGAISAQPGGHVFLVAPNVENTGIITAPNGDVVLAAGRQVQLVDSRDPDMHVVVSAPDDKAVNLGQVISQGGRIGIYGALVRQRGEVNANSAVVGQNGKIVLKASGDTLLEQGSRTTATGAGNGGSVHVLGDRVAMTGNASIDVSGGANGGTVLMGGDYRGQNPLYASAQQTWMGKDASIKADAGSSGKGGKVILWATDATRAFGTISARGVNEGGFIETSADYLDVNGLRVDTSALNGQHGLWLLDPMNITVGLPSCFTACVDIGPEDAAVFSRVPDVSGLISVDTLLRANSDIRLEAKNHIRFNDALNAGTYNITALAGGSIDVDAPLTTSGGTITLHANNGTFGATGNGAVNVNHQIRTNGGSVMLRGASINVATMADPLVAAIDTGGGRIDMAADALAEGSVNIKGLVKTGGGYVALSGPGISIGDSALPGKGGIDSSGGIIDLTADSLKIGAPVKAGTTGGTGLVTILPMDRSMPIVVDETATGDVLHLTNSELGNIHAAQLRIGGFDLTGDITWSLVGKYDFGTISLATQNKVTFDNLLENLNAAGRIDVSADTIDLAAGASGNGTIRANTVSLNAKNVNVAGSLKSDTGRSDASISISANTLAVGGSVNAGAGNIFVRPADGALPIEIASIKDNGKLALTPAELGRFSGDTLILGTSGVTGGLNVKAGTSLSLSNLRSLSLNTGGALNIDGSIDLTHIDGALLASSFGGAVNVGGGGALMAPFVFVNASSLDMAGMIDADNVLIQGNSGVSSIHVGTGAADSAGVLGISQDELARISASGLTISAHPLSENTRIDVTGATSWGYVDTALKLDAGLGSIGIQAPLTTPGAIVLQSAGQIDQGATGSITADLLQISSLPGRSVNVYLDSSTAINNVRSLSATGVDDLYFSTLGDLVIGDGMYGIEAADESVWGNIFIDAAGHLQMAKPIIAQDSSVNLTGTSVTIGTDAPVLSFTSSMEPPPSNILADDVYLEARGGAITMRDNAHIDAYSVDLVADKMDFASQAGIHTPVEGTVSIYTHDYNKAIRIGQGALDIDGVALGLSEDELRIIDSGYLDIGGYGEGSSNNTLSVVGALDLSGNTRLYRFSLYSEGGVTIDAPVHVPESLDIGTNGNVQLNAGIQAKGIYLSGHSILGAGLLKAANEVELYAHGGIGSLSAPVNTETTWLDVSNHDTSASGTPINVRNNAAAPGSLYVEYAAQEGGGKGSITIENFGGMHVGDVSASSGDVGLTTHSPMAIEGSVTTTSGAIKLVAEGSDGNILVNAGASVTSDTGDITLNAGGAITAPDGSITTGGVKTLTAGVVTTPPPAPTLTQCLTTPSLTGCAAVLDAALDACIVDKTGANCAQLLPTISMCVADETRKGCSVVLPTLEQCLANRTADGCSVVLPTTAECAATPGLPGCVASGPTLEQCIANPSISGCSSVLPPLAVCVADKTTPGCQAVLPDLAVCIADKTAAGCEAVLPGLAACIADKTVAGCGVVLPSLEACIANKATAGCEVVLPNMTACLADKTAPGCDTVLPKLAACIADKSTPGCEVILPNITACVADKTAPGCEVVLPSLAVCIADKTTAGCVVVLPQLTACIADKTTAGCEVVLPNMAACIANKTAAGCEVVLPNMAACIANKAAAGCEVVLPNLAACIANKSAAGCEVVLPTMTACIANKATAGCEVILPSLASCIANKGATGCEVVLPQISQCVANPTLGGCEVILPTLTQCIADKASPGCEVILPTMAECIGSPSLGGCSVILPSLQQCALNPNLQGCAAVLPKPDFCSTHPTDPTCQVFNPGTGQGGEEKAPVAEAVQTTVTLVSKNPVTTLTPAAGSGSGSTADQSQGQQQGQQQGEPEKPSDKEQAAAPAENTGVKNEKPATKTYCN